ncbi:MAG: SAF domain-containing protein, partial [Sedimentisphaerales bacterium]
MNKVKSVRAQEHKSARPHVSVRGPQTRVFRCPAAKNPFGEPLPARRGPKRGAKYLAPPFRRGLTFVIMTGALLCQGAVSNKTNLQIYLPREVTIPALSEVEGEDSYLKLGRVSIIRGEQSLVEQASEITLGRLSVPGQKIVVDRSTVLSRLACNGIPTRKVTLTGAEKITVKKQYQVIKGSDFVELASAFLKKNLPCGSVYQLSPLWIPKDLNIGGLSKDVRLSPRLVKSSARNQAKVQIAVLVPGPVGDGGVPQRRKNAFGGPGKEVAVREVTFRLKYNRRTAVTLAEIPAGAVISPENVKIGKIVSDYPEPANWNPPYGLIAKRRLPANTVIRPDMVGPVESAVVVGRNETVVIRIERP